MYELPSDSIRKRPENTMHAHNSDPERQAPPMLGDGKHKLRLSISLGVLALTACILPEVLYFTLRYQAPLKDTIALAVPMALFGAPTMFTFAKRCWSLGRKQSTTRPIGGGRWGFDFFHWNFALGIVYITAVICVATALKPASVRGAAMPLSLLMIQVCAQLVGVHLLMKTNLPYVCRVSSMPKGQSPIRPALYTIIEDLIAVEGEQGTAWRELFDQRYQNSPALQQLLARLSLVWGVSGLAVATMNIVLIFVLKNEDIGFAIGWSVPWVWVGLMSIPTWFWVRAARD